MSSAYRRGDGKSEVAYYFDNPVTDQRRRHKVKLGRITPKRLQRFQDHLDELIACREAGVPLDVELKRWLRKLSNRVHAQLARSGLVRPRVQATVGELCDKHLATLKKKKNAPSTLVNIGRLHANLRDYFESGGPRRLRTIRADDAEDFRDWALRAGSAHGGNLAESTVATRCRRARDMFNLAIKLRWLRPGRNPFEGMESGSESNPAREVYIPWDDVLRVLEYCTCPQFRLFVAMTRLCGIRSPSDVVPFTWSQIDRPMGIMLAHSQKNRRFEHKRTRYIPIFTELASYIDQAWEAAACGEDLVFPDLQISNAALSDRLESLCRKAGLVLWPKPLVNLRASGERDMWRLLPYNDVVSILDHSPKTAQKHYNRFSKDLLARAEGRALRLPDLDWVGSAPGSAQT